MRHFEQAGLFVVFTFAGVPVAAGQEFKTGSAKHASYCHLL